MAPQWIVWSGTALTAYGTLALALNIRRFLRDERAEGLVVGAVRRTGMSQDGHEYMYHPKVEFAARSGEVFTFTDGGGASHIQYKNGTTVQVLYNPRNPQKAVILRVQSLWVGPVGFMLFGIAILMGAYLKG